MLHLAPAHFAVPGVSARRTIKLTRDINILFPCLRTCCFPRRVLKQPASQEMLDLLQDLRKKVVIGFVGGSNLVKQIEQLSVRGHDSGLLAYL